jgi:hypothetical protein
MSMEEKHIGLHSDRSLCTCAIAMGMMHLIRCMCDNGHLVHLPAMHPSSVEAVVNYFHPRLSHTGIVLASARWCQLKSSVPGSGDPPMGVRASHLLDQPVRLVWYWRISIIPTLKEVSSGAPTLCLVND